MTVSHHHLQQYGTGAPDGFRLSNGQRLANLVTKDENPFLVIDDSIATGTSYHSVKKLLKDPHVYGAIYTTSYGATLADYYHQVLELPHWFEWHILGSPRCLARFNAGVDIDGLLCPDFLPEEDDDGPAYSQRLKTMPCIRHPGAAVIPYLVTARLEKYRKETVEWLRRNQIKYNNLIMIPSPSLKKSPGEWKASVCKDNGIRLFIESCPHQAKIISCVTRTIHP